MEATMRFKVFIVYVFFVCCLLPGISLAQNKVVVIPLGDPEIAGAVVRKSLIYENQVQSPIVPPYTSGYQNCSCDDTDDVMINVGVINVQDSLRIINQSIFNNDNVSQTAIGTARLYNTDVTYGHRFYVVCWCLRVD